MKPVRLHNIIFKDFWETNHLPDVLDARRFILDKLEIPPVLGRLYKVKTSSYIRIVSSGGLIVQVGQGLCDEVKRAEE